MSINEPCFTIGTDNSQGGIDNMLKSAWQLVTSNVEASGALIDKIRELSISAGYDKGIDECMLLKARYDGEMDRYFDALQIANDANRKYILEGNIAGQIRACRVLGYLYSRHGNYNSALEHLFQSLKLIKDGSLDVEEGLYPIEAFLLNNIAFIYAETGRDNEALSFFYQAFEIVKKSGGSMIATILTNIAEMHLNTGDARMALRYNKMALTEIKRQKLGYHDVHNCYNSFGLIYKKMEQYDKAIDSFKMSLDAAIKSESKYNQIVSCLALGRLYLLMQNAGEARDIASTAFALADEIKANALLRDICLVMAQALESLGDMHGAMNYYKKHMELNYEISTRDVEQRLSDYTAEFKAEQAIKDAEIYRLKNIELKQKSEELEKSNRHITLIGEIGQKITATLDIEDVLSTIYINISRLMDINLFGVGLYDEPKGIVTFRMIIENGIRLPTTQTDINGGFSFVADCIKAKKPVVINDILTENIETAGLNRIATNGVAPRALIFYPLILAGTVIGVMTVQSYTPNAYSHNNIETIQALGSYIAVALNNSQKSEELQQKARELELLSKTDPLTGLYNRRYIIEKLEEERTRYRRYGKKFCLIILDIDLFKRVNDNWGHDCGDYVLVEISRHLKQLLREQDCLARWGGEEFLVMLPETDAEGAETLANRLRIMIMEKVFECRKKHISVTLTMGICEYGEGINIDTAIRKADNALYEGKKRGRNCVVVAQ